MKEIALRCCLTPDKPLFGNNFGQQKKKQAFTQAEAAAVLVILGLVAAITIPSVINNHQTAINRVKIKNALGTYKEAVKSMVSENRIKDIDTLNSWAKGPNNDCANARRYFKVVETDANGCQFKTSDGLWWDVGSDANLRDSRMNKAIVAFKKADLTHNMAINELTYKAFYMACSFDDNGGLRMMDTIYSFKSSDTVQILNSLKLFAFINNKTMNDYAIYCDSSANRGIGRNSCFYIYGGTAYILNSRGEVILNRSGCRQGSFGCSSSGIGNIWSWDYDKVCDNSGKNCYSSCGEDCYIDPATGEKRYHYALTPNCEAQGDYCQGGTVSFWAKTEDFPENPLQSSDADAIFEQLDPNMLKTIQSGGKTGENLANWHPASTGQYYSCEGVRPGDSNILSTCGKEPSDIIYQYQLGGHIIKCGKTADGNTYVSIWKVGAFPHNPYSVVQIAEYGGCDNWKNCTTLKNFEEVPCGDNYCTQTTTTDLTTQTD